VIKYRQAIENLSNQTDKDEATRLLNDLIFAVKNIDNMYVDMVYKKQLPSLGNELKEKIISIRKNLDSKLIKKNN
jgi:hypothetical protein